MQYQIRNGGLWHSLGEYLPGMHTELGGGALFLPKDVNIRVIETPKTAKEQDAPRVIQNWGVLGDGLRSLYINNDMCYRERSDNNSSSPSPVNHNACPPTKKPVPTWLIYSVSIIALLALVAGVTTVLLLKRKSN
jgi:hypothetical protein